MFLLPDQFFDEINKLATYDRHLYKVLVALAELPLAEKLPPETRQAPPQQAGKKVLSGWREILNAVGMKAHETNKLRSLAAATPGCPIKFGTTGQRPKVIDVDFLKWWGAVVESLQGNRTAEGVTIPDGAAESVSDTYQHGRGSAVVVPGIAGHEKKTRSKKLTKAG